ncbi:sugar transferase [Blastomonas sp.]|uniref:sugar transferase n=1 Tax=Blastomonas sp. TaxID=1909299 RepID=UPI00258C4003|nr:sugar transferase [Blastomonas sp.]
MASPSNGTPRVLWLTVHLTVAKDSPMLSARQTKHSGIGEGADQSVLLQILLAICLGVLLPPMVFFGAHPYRILGIPEVFNSGFGSIFAILTAQFIAPRVTEFPGSNRLSYTLPIFMFSYAVVIAAIVTLRVPYSVVFLSISFTTTIIIEVMFAVMRHRLSKSDVYLVPGGRVGQVLAISDITPVVMTTPALPESARAILVADLHYDLDAERERTIAEATLRGIPVYHYKQVLESLTGQVNIEHMSEYLFGSLLPDLTYARAKRVGDVLISLALLPILALPLLIVAVLIRLDSPGPALFLQTRMGYAKKPFKVIKFRTMRVPDPSKPVDATDMAMTKHGDSRITKLGSFLRRTRIDELPQIFNVIKGDMSWIGPRPEAIVLSEWYEGELPFYSYRHIVRPGITGWAQINQGHVTDINDITMKLHYDFYYIKNFSYWLDLTITARTVWVILTGFGSK